MIPGEAVIIALRLKIIGGLNTKEKMKKSEKMLPFFVFLLKMITTTNYNSQKLSLGSLQNKKSRDGKNYQNIPILYDERKAIVHLCGRFMVIPGYVVSPPGESAIEEVVIMGDNFGKNDTYSIAIEVDADNRKLFEDFEGELMYFLENYPGEPWPESVTDNIRLIQKIDKVYLKLHFDEGKPVPKFWKVIEKDGEERKRRIWDTESLNWKKIEGEIVFSIANIFIGRKQEPKSIICVAKEILVREIIKDEKSYFSYETDEEE